MTADITDLAAIRPKALAALRDGRVTILHARMDSGSKQPHEIIGSVRSGDPERADQPPYVVDLLDAVWDCTCDKPAPCPHIAAVQLVTGHPSTAAARLKAASA